MHPYGSCVHHPIALPTLANVIDEQCCLTIHRICSLKTRKPGIRPSALWSVSVSPLVDASWSLCIFLFSWQKWFIEVMWFCCVKQAKCERRVAAICPSQYDYFSIAWGSSLSMYAYRFFYFLNIKMRSYSMLCPLTCFSPQLNASGRMSYPNSVNCFFLFEMFCRD